MCRQTFGQPQQGAQMGGWRRQGSEPWDLLGSYLGSCCPALAGAATHCMMGDSLRGSFSCGALWRTRGAQRSLPGISDFLSLL